MKNKKALLTSYSTLKNALCKNIYENIGEFMSYNI